MALESGELAKLIITPQIESALYEDLNKRGFAVQFNPTNLSISKTVSWTERLLAERNDNNECVCSPRNVSLNAPELEFAGGGARTVRLELLFDVTQTSSDADVRQLTQNLVRLTRIDRKLQHPPICSLSWGVQESLWYDLPLRCVATNLDQDFLLFSRDGIPQRAKVTVQFTENIDVVQDKKQTDPDLTTYIVKRGDTLTSIAAANYKNTIHWRLIATANDIDDPRALRPGARLTIPRLV